SQSQAQSIVIEEGDTIFICEPGTVLLHAAFQGADSSDLESSEPLSTVDDTHSGVVDIGFPFTFYGNTYTQCVLSTNFYITFDLSNADQYSAWPINNPLPTPDYPANNVIMGPWQDTYPGAWSAPQPGWVSYTTIGDAPNRVFIFNMCMVPMYSCTDSIFTGQIKLFETTNNIEFHLTEKSVCETWNSGQAVMGLMNEDGTLYEVVNGYDANTMWTAQNEAWLLTPNGANDYDWAPTTYDPVQVYATNQLQWQYMGQPTVFSDTVELYVTESGWAYVEFFGCFGSAFTEAGSDSIYIAIGDPATVISQRVSACNNPLDNALFAHFLPSETAPFDLTWTDAAGTVLQSVLDETEVDSLVDIPAGTYNLQVVNAVGCTLNYEYIVPVREMVPDFTTAPDLICQYTPVTFTSTSTGSITGFQWTFGDGAFGVGENASYSYIVGGDSIMVTLTIANDTFPLSCVFSDTAFVNVHPNIAAAYTSPGHLCVGDYIFITDASLPNPVSWEWYVNDSLVSTDSSFVFPASELGSYQIGLVVTDSLCGMDSLSNEVTINSYPVVDIGNDTLLCPGESITLDAGNPGMAYQWSNGATTQTLNLQIDQTSILAVSVDNAGCTATDQIMIAMNCSMMFPNAFSPNRDGVNDMFLPRLVNMETYSMRIYNRWGELVYAIDDGHGDVR
ncbi:MAG TPA: gliding motility-associated C-terminal domain-containing protein, partial [Chitinophagales bacterium]|nr:gliding motility-associated C-terminal domain-containing protein [Chitinophagales bacterium]